MPGCPQCGRQWPEGYQRCPDDGVLLFMPAQSGAATGGNAAPELFDTADEELPVGSHAGDYQIERTLGEGGMGTVYGARHPLIGKRAAIKVIRRELSSSKDAVDRFVLEAQSVNQIGHPNIVDVFGFGRLPDGRSYFVMEWLDGESLRERLRRPLPFPEALQILEDIAKPLQAAHEAGVVHRDLKPDNVFLATIRGEPQPKVKLLDFGLAKLTGGETQRFDKTRTGVVMGTPLYLSPQQAKGLRVDASTDVYSLGAMAYEMFSGQAPFRADSAVEIMAMHISAHPPSLAQVAPWVPPEIQHLVMSMLAKDPRERPSTANVREAIAACRSSSAAVTVGMSMAPVTQPPPRTPMNAHAPTVAVTPPSVTPPIVTPPPVQAPKSRVGLMLILLAFAGAAIGVGLYLVFGTKQQQQEQPAHVAMKEQPQPQPQVQPQPQPQVQPQPQPEPEVEAKPQPEPPAEIEKKHEAVKRRGKLAIEFEGPSKATVLVDGKPAKRDASGKVVVEVGPGEHRVRIEAKGFKPAEKKLRVEAGGTKDVSLTLEKRPEGVNAVHDPFAD